MAKKRVINGKNLEFAKKLFAKPEEKQEKVKKVEKAKEECPHCGKEYVNLNRHINTCIQNPQRVVPVKVKIEAPSPTITTRRKVYVEEEIIEKPDWSQLIVESASALKSLTEYLREIKENGVKVQLIK